MDHQTAGRWSVRKNVTRKPSLIAPNSQLCLMTTPIQSSPTNRTLTAASTGQPVAVGSIWSAEDYLNFVVPQQSGFKSTATAR